MYLKNILKICLLWFVWLTTMHAYTLSKEDAYYVPIMMDDISIMVALKPAEVTSPSNGATIDSTLSLKFSKGTGVEKRFLKVFYSNHKKKLAHTYIVHDTYNIGGLPEDGKYVHVELYSYIADKYFVKKYRFIQSTNPSELIARSKLHLNGATDIFSWTNGTNVTYRYMYVGTRGYGSNNIFEGSVSGTSKTLYNLPKNGEPIYVILQSRINGKLVSRYYKYFATDVEFIAKDFVKAYLKNNIPDMRKIAPQRVIDKLKTKNSTVKSYFRKIRSYHKLLYFHDYQAMVIGKTSDHKEIKFYFSWDGSRWVLESVI